MTWTHVRPADPSVLSGRPLLDVGTGDGQTLLSLAGEPFDVVAVDRSLDLLRVIRRSGLAVAGAEAIALPFRDSTFGTVLAGDLFHHLDDSSLSRSLAEALRVLRPGGHLVAWWYASPGVDAPDAPKFPRPYEPVAGAAEAAGFAAAELELTMELEAGPKTVGLLASR